MEDDSIKIQVNRPEDEQVATTLEAITNRIVSKMDLERAVQVAVQNYINEMVGGTDAILSIYDQIEMIAKEAVNRKLQQDNGGST